MSLKQRTKLKCDEYMATSREEDRQVVRDVLSNLASAMEAERGRMWREINEVSEVVNEIEAALPLPTQTRQITQRIESAAQDLFGPIMRTYESLAQEDERFSWRMDEPDWDEIRSYSKLSNDARRTLEALITFNRAYVRSAATPTCVHDFMRELTAFLGRAKSFSVSDSARSFFADEQTEPHSKPDSEKGSINVMLELSAVIGSLERISCDFSDTHTSRSEITEHLVESLDNLLRYYANRRISFGTAANNDLDWATKIFKLVGHPDDGLQGAIKALIRKRYGT